MEPLIYSWAWLSIFPDIIVQIVYLYFKIFLIHLDVFANSFKKLISAWSPIEYQKRLKFLAEYFSSDCP